MELITIKEVKERMNSYGKSRTPFLVAVDFEVTQGFMLTHPLENDEVLFGVGTSGNTPSVPVSRPVDIYPSPISLGSYQKKFATVHNGLMRGDSFLTNLTVKTPVELSLSLEEVFHLTRAPYKICLPGRFVCFSPERFIAIRNGKIATNPMKGTIDAAIPDAQQKILDDFKETAEHSTIVDLLRNDLSMVASDVKVERFRYIDRIPTRKGELLQVSSEIIGTLPENYREQLGDIFLRLLPAGSVSGAPKPATLKLIREAEQESRGFYTGVFGYYDGEHFDSAVMIRFIEQEGERFYYRSGGGVTVYSDLESEYKEIIDKIYLPV